MQIIVCVDDNMGMLFNKRRQSRDKMVVEDILKNAEKVWLHPFSQELFQEHTDKIIADEEFLSKAQGNEICFVENQVLQPYLQYIDKIVLYRWNRKYPSDFKMDIPLESLELVEQDEFPGNSHDKITKETYVWKRKV